MNKLVCWFASRDWKSYFEASPIQEQTIPLATDVIDQAQTGTGKLQPLTYPWKIRTEEGTIKALVITQLVN